MKRPEARKKICESSASDEAKAKALRELDLNGDAQKIVSKLIGGKPSKPEAKTKEKEEKKDFTPKKILNIKED